MKKFKIIAHRCGYKESKYDENSLSSLIYCNHKNYIDGVEFDVILTKDQELAVFHDSSITINKEKVNVSDLTFEELDKFYYDKHHSHLSKLNDMLENIKNSKEVYIEMKNVAPLNNFKYKKTVEILEKEIKKYPRKKSRIICFVPKALNYFYKLNQKIPLGLLVSKKSYLYEPSLIYNMYFNYKITTIAIHKSMVSLELAKKILKRHYLAIYTIDTKEEFQKIKKILEEYFQKMPEKIIIITSIPKIINVI